MGSCTDDLGSCYLLGSSHTASGKTVLKSMFDRAALLNEEGCLDTAVWYYGSDSIRYAMYWSPLEIILRLEQTTTTGLEP